MQRVKELFYGLRTVVIILYRWTRAKIRGEPYDSGMDM